MGNKGPDFTAGYGIINVTQAAQHIIDDNGQYSLIKEDSTKQFKTKKIWNFVIPVSGWHLYQFVYRHPVDTPIKVTLVWDDFPAALPAGKTLVNDLTLVLRAPNGTLYFPYILNASSPADPATTGWDNRNNVEQIVAPPMRGVWRVLVRGDLVPEAPQNYSLITPKPAKKIFG